MMAAFLRRQTAASACRGLRMGFLAETLGLAVGYARSAATAAVIGDMRAAAVRFEQARLCAIAAIETWRGAPT